MCGFCGFTISKDINNKQVIKTMNEKLIKRGPNFQDIYLDNNIALGHTRLSIIDLSASRESTNEN